MSSKSDTIGLAVPIRKMADFYSVLLVLLSAVVVIVTIIRVIVVVDSAGSYWSSSETAELWLTLGTGIIALAVCGASAVLIDIMLNVRIIAKSGGSDNIEGSPTSDDSAA